MRAITFGAAAAALAVSGILNAQAFASSTPQGDAAFRKACATMAERGIKVPECTIPAPLRTAVAMKVPLNPRSSIVALPPPADTTGDPFFILRQDQYDQVSYVLPAQAYQVLQGAALNYTNDQKAKSQSISTKGFLGYSAYNWKSAAAETSCASTNGPGFLARYGFGPFIQADGSFNEPTNANEKSALRAGIDINTAFCDTAVFQKQDFQFLPYGQTDFRGKAGIAGFDALWEPYFIDGLFHLGGRTDVLTPKIVGYYFRVLGEANVFNVYNAGLTNFQSNTAYALFGTTVEARAVLFENNPNVPSALCGTITLVGTARNLWDAVSHKAVDYYGAEVSYRLGGKSASTVNCKGADPLAPNAVGSSSVSLTYNTGKNPTTFVTQNVYKAGLKFSY
jgi:hypothetical protein